MIILSFFKIESLVFFKQTRNSIKTAGFFIFYFYITFFCILYILYLDKAESLNLYPSVERVEKKKGSKFSITCTTEHMQYYSRRFNWFKDSRILTDKTLVIRHSTFVRLNFVSLKLGDSGMYKCNITDDPKVPERHFHLIVFGKSF